MCAGQAGRQEASKTFVSLAVAIAAGLHLHNWRRRRGGIGGQLLQLMPCPLDGQQRRAPPREEILRGSGSEGTPLRNRTAAIQ